MLKQVSMTVRFWFGYELICEIIKFIRWTMGNKIRWSALFFSRLIFLFCFFCFVFFFPRPAAAGGKKRCFENNEYLKFKWKLVTLNVLILHPPRRDGANKIRQSALCFSFTATVAGGKKPCFETMYSKKKWIYLIGRNHPLAGARTPPLEGKIGCYWDWQNQVLDLLRLIANFFPTAIK